MTVWSIIADLIIIITLTIGSSGILYLAYLERKRYNDFLDREITKERIRRYRDIMERLTEMNNTVISLSQEGDLKYQAELLAMDNESDLDEVFDSLNDEYQRNYHIVGKDVQDGLEEYLSYLATYHDQGIELEKVLNLSSIVVQYIREDIGLDMTVKEDKLFKDT